MRNRMSDFDRSFNRMRRFNTIFIGTVFVLIIAILIGVPIVLLTLDWTGAAHSLGGVVRAFMDGMEAK